MWILGMYEIGELSRAQSALLGLLCPVNQTVSLCGLLLPLLVRMLCIHLTGEGVATGLGLPQVFFSSLIINHFCACLPQEAESYSSVGPCLFSVFPVLSAVPGKKDVLKELLIHKKLIYEEYNFPEAVWDGGRTREFFFFFSSMTNMRNRGFTFHYTNSWTQRKGIYSRQNLAKRGLSPRLMVFSLGCLLPFQVLFDSNPYRHIQGHTTGYNRDNDIFNSQNQLYNFPNFIKEMC